VAMNVDFDERVAIKEFFMKGVTERDETTSVVSVSNSENVPQFEEQLEKFKKEARRLRKLKNEHIVKVHNLFEENGTAYYEMDYVDGESLAEKMKRTGCAMAESEVKAILLQILEALKEVHQNEIWHLDIKPGNILVDKHGSAYLIDFGASKQLRANGSMTTSTALCYTPGYAPNEQIGQMYDLFGPWTDIYALGATIYNLLTNKKPPRVIDIEEDEEDAFTFSESVSKDMKELVCWMMQPKRKKRPQNVDEILGKLLGNHIDEDNLKIEQENEETIIVKPEIKKEEKKENKINEFNGHQYIDLGLSVYWASMNIGASSGNDGVEYIWGDSNGWIFEETNESFIKSLYNYRPGELNICGNDQYDTATNMWGAKWRMPTFSEFHELFTKCQWQRIDDNNIKLIGPNGNCIVLSCGRYWTGEKMVAFTLSIDIPKKRALFSYAELWEKKHLKTLCLIRPVMNK